MRDHERTANLTPFQRDYTRMIDTLEVEIGRVGAADTALTRRIALPDHGRLENDRVNSSGTSDPAGNEAVRRMESLENRERYRDEAVLAIWSAIKDAKRATDAVLRNEPLPPHGAAICETRKGTPTACTNWASPHTNPHNGMIATDLCDDCWQVMCPRCYIRPMAEYRATCDACRKRAERDKEAA